jgi:DNA polymerase-3 subunit beta
MKVICDRGALMDSLALAGSVAATRTPKPVLQCVKLTADADTGLTLAATDMEVSIRLSTPRVEVAEPGEALVPADKLTQIVRESIDPTLEIHTEQDVSHITGRDSKYKVFGHPPADFPPVPELTGDPDFEISAAQLHKLLALTTFATARENSRYAINGVLIERKGGELSVVATDGHRLAYAKGQAESNNDQTRSAIVPSKALQLLMRLFDDAEQTVKVKIADNQVHFATDGSTLTSNLVEGNFPPYQDVIPKDQDRKATLSTDTMISAVRRVALLTSEESKGVRMAFGPDGLTMSSRAPEMGEAEVKVDVPDYTGEPIEIGFNPTYLLDALKVIEDEQVTLEFKAGNKPGLLRTGPDFLYVVMPVNLQ